MRIYVKVFTVIVLGGMLAAVLGTAMVPVGCPFQEQRVGIAFVRDAQEARRSRIRLLCETDHQALLRAGREILSQLPKALYPGHASGDVVPIPEGIDIPDVILRLRPRGVVVRIMDQTVCLMVAMHGGLASFGVNIYADDALGPASPHQFGDRELLPGLWYYDDAYLRDPAYDKAIDTLIEEHKKKQER